MGSQSKAASASNICLKDRKFLTAQKIAPYTKLLSNLAQNLISKLPPSPNVFSECNVVPIMIILSLRTYNFEFSETSPKKILNTLKGLNPSKTLITYLVNF